MRLVQLMYRWALRQMPRAIEGTPSENESVTIKPKTAADQVFNSLSDATLCSKSIHSNGYSDCYESIYEHYGTKRQLPDVFKS